LLFFAAIDEGMVLTIAEPEDLVEHLGSELQALRQPGDPIAVLGFDCILRRIEAQQKQMTGGVSKLLREHGVIGFSTYGEQSGPMHINHTMTGFAFYPPGTVISGSDPLTVHPKDCSTRPMAKREISKNSSTSSTHSCDTSNRVPVTGEMPLSSFAAQPCWKTGCDSARATWKRR